LQPGDRFNPYRFFHGVHIPDVLVAADMSWGAKVVYARLCRFAGDRGYAFPKQDTLAAALGISSRQIRTYLAELEETGLIRREKGGPGQASRYVFLWADLFHSAFHSYSDEGPDVVEAKPDRKPTSAKSGIHTSAKSGRNPPVSKEEIHIRDSREVSTPPDPPQGGFRGRESNTGKRSTPRERQREEILRRMRP
jgi:hypothetical protein